MHKHVFGVLNTQWICGIVVGSCLIAFTRGAAGADLWGGSAALTNDYLVRGISRSDHDPALQLDVFYLTDSGLIAGTFASNARLNPRQSWTAELNGYLGYAWTASSDWRGKLLATYYAYPGSGTAPSYDYGEIDVDVNYRQWLGVSISYSPDMPRFGLYDGLRRVASTSVDINLQQAVIGNLASTVGIGYERFFSDAEPSGFIYWSVGLAYNMSQVLISIAYADTNNAAKSLFLSDASRGRWIASVIRRF